MEARPFGLWDSPLRPRSLASSRVLRDVAWTPDGRGLVWLEGRGDQGVLVYRAGRDGAPRDLDPTVSVRAQVHGGGGDFAVGGGQVFFVERDGRLYRQALASGSPRPVTPPFGRAASPRVSPDGRWVAYVHTGEGTDRLAIVDAAGAAWPQVLASGADFYMQPAWHPSGRMLAWIEWDHPHMPWDATRLVLARLRRAAGGAPQVVERRVVAGGDAVAAFQPEFSRDGRHLAYASDEGGWSAPWLHRLDAGASTCLAAGPGEVALPAWSQGLRALAFSADSQTLYFTRVHEGRRTAWSAALATGRVSALEPLAPYTWVEQPAAAPRGAGLAVIASSAQVPPRVLRLDRRGGVEVVARAAAESVAPAALAEPRHLSWTTAAGRPLHGLYYPPTSPRFASSGLPPAILMVHGGPNSQAHTAHNPRNQFFATRGYAVFEVNYRGSTGYGRAYRQALDGQWGVADLEDTVAASERLVELRLADPGRLVVMGSSAGGYTVLRALTARPGYFRAGVCVYGIANLFTLASGTHKLEERYLDSLLGVLPAAAAVYRERSPLFAVEALRDPVAVYHGADDQVVPPAQSEALVESLRRRQVPHEYRVFPGEGHGWRRPETIEAFFQSVEAFLRQHVLFA